MKWLLMGIVAAGVVVGAGLAGGLDGVADRAGDRAVELYRRLAASSLLAPSPPERTPPPARPVPARAVVSAAETAPQATPTPRIARRPDGAPGETLTEADRDRLNQIIEARLKR
ncbi:MAG: hypothetical protein ABIJ09_19050 [Pseudomonadota bacterium]|nr:hypothetical protein [Patescibacteria group bacterium]